MSDDIPATPAADTPPAGASAAPTGKGATFAGVSGAGAEVPAGIPAGPAPNASAARPPGRRLHVQAIPIERPPFRRLTVYAFDPSLSVELEHAGMNRVTMKVPWEFDPASGHDILCAGPIGEYVEVVDVDPASRAFYAPVNLNDPYLLARDGLPPAEGNPQFHQQMVYAVAMTTIKNFEAALGRRALWAPDEGHGTAGGSDDGYIQKLRIYPHALREANAYYSPDKKALLFGYFAASATIDPRQHLPGGMVFCCLSHDVVAHETTHALLDGMHHRYLEPSNPDVLAFHEAFADIVALFQHFSLADVLRHQIAKTRGDLGSENLLAQLAQEFGQATGLHGALRDALGGYNEKAGRWERSRPDPGRLQTVLEPHARGSLLVAAVFEAFVSIYRARIADLLRLATSGSGVLPEGQLHPDLVNRLAAEAAKAAQHVLNMCIRALDYCAPVDVTFGDFLRALITADYDLVPDDDLGYRVAMVEAFRRYGIYPLDVRSLSVDSLRWMPPTRPNFQPTMLPLIGDMRRFVHKGQYTFERVKLFQQQRTACQEVQKRLAPLIPALADDMGLDPNRRGPDGQPTYRVQSVRPAQRIGPDGERLTDVVIEITQSRPGYFDADAQAAAEQAAREGRLQDIPPADFDFWGGCTLLVDLTSGLVRYCVAKNVNSDARLQRERCYLNGELDTSPRAMYFGGLTGRTLKEPFAFLHRMAG
jgi:hypothetical protein